MLPNFKRSDHAVMLIRIAFETDRIIVLGIFVVESCVNTIIPQFSYQQTVSAAPVEQSVAAPEAQKLPKPKNKHSALVDASRGGNVGGTGRYA